MGTTYNVIAVLIFMGVAFFLGAIIENVKGQKDLIVICLEGHEYIINKERSILLLKLTDHGTPSLCKEKIKD